MSEDQAKVTEPLKVAEPPTLLENLKTTRQNLLNKLGLLDDAIAIAKKNPAVLDFQETITKFQKTRV